MSTPPYFAPLQEARLALVRLFSAFAFDLEPGQVPLSVALGLTMSPRDGVWVRLRPRAPAAKAA